MHELGLCESILGAVEQRAAGRPVTRVRVRIGVRHRVAEASLKRGFALVSTGTTAHGAEIDMVVVPVQIACTTCGNHTATTDLLALCPVCGSEVVTVTGGDDVILEELEISAA